MAQYQRIKTRSEGCVCVSVAAGLSDCQPLTLHTSCKLARNQLPNQLPSGHVDLPEAPDAMI